MEIKTWRRATPAGKQAHEAIIDMEEGLDDTKAEVDVCTAVSRSHFSQQEAQSKVGRRVATVAAWPRCPKGTRGTVQAVTQFRQRFPETAVPAVYVLWHGCTCQSGRPLVMGFCKKDYEEFLIEVDEEASSAAQIKCTAGNP